MAEPFSPDMHEADRIFEEKICRFSRKSKVVNKILSMSQTEPQALLSDFSDS